MYNNSREEYIIHVRQVLEKLREARLQTNITKYEFFVTHTKFLNLIVRINGIKIDPKKIRTILE